MAMGITQALKLEQGPIDALARLPQQELISMAQQGRLPANILPLVLNEKAQMIQQAANMQAAQRPMPPSVIEQAMATNAQAEAQPQMQPQMPQMTQAPQMPEAGIANLPIPEDMYSGGEGQEYAGGGIVAFDDGGHVPSYAGPEGSWVSRNGLYEWQEAPVKEGIPSLGKYVAQYESLMAPYRQLSEAEKTLLTKSAPPSAEEVTQDRWMRALQAGLGILGGESPYFGVNVGKGTQEAAKGWAEDVKERRKQELAYLQLQADAARKEREAKMADVTGGLGLYQKEADRAIEAQKGKELTQTAQTIYNEAKAAGKPITMEEAFTRATMATTRPPDRYTALNNRVIAANKDFAARASILQMQYDQAKDDTARKVIADKIKNLRDAVMTEYSITQSDLNELQKLDRATGLLPSTPSSSAKPSGGFSGREITSNR